MNTLTKQQFEQKLADDRALIINVLDVEFFNNERIPGSVNAPVAAVDFMEQVEDLTDKNRPIVLYSGGKDCPAAETAARKLEEEGYTNVSTFLGGMEEWKEKGGALESNIPGAVDSPAKKASTSRH